MTDINLIWAQASNGVIGHQGTMPWHLPEDLKHFKVLTHGGTVLMGKGTWNSLPESFRPLPGRKNMVLTSSDTQDAVGALCVSSIEEALALTSSEEELWVIGGGTVYSQMLPLATKVYITFIDLDTSGDTYAPSLDETWTEEVPTSWQVSSTGLVYRFATFVRA